MISSQIFPVLATFIHFTVLHVARVFTVRCLPHVNPGYTKKNTEKQNMKTQQLEISTNFCFCLLE